MEEATGEDHVTAVRMNDTIWLNATGCRWSCGGGLFPHCSWYCSGHVGKGCRWHCGGGLIPHCSWHCSGHFGGRRLAEGAAEENAAMEEATGEDHVTAVRMNDTIWLNATGCRWSCGGGLFPHCSWYCSGHVGKGCRWHC